MDCEGNVFPTTTYPLVYVKMEKIYTHEILLDGDGDQELHELRGDIIVRFYENSTGTVPYHVSDPDFIVSLFVDSRSDIYPPISRPFTKLGMGTSTILLSNVPIGEQFSQRNFDTNQFEVINTTNYQFYLLSDDKYSIISN